VNGPLRLSAGLYAVFGILLLLEGVWIVVGRSGFAVATHWAELHPSEGVPLPVLAGAGFLVLAWGLLRRYRWAWLVAFTWALIWVIPGVALLGLLLFHPVGAVWAHSHHVETGLAILSVPCLVANLVILSLPTVRRAFGEQGGAGREAVS